MQLPQLDDGEIIGHKILELDASRMAAAKARAVGDTAKQNYASSRQVHEESFVRNEEEAMRRHQMEQHAKALSAKQQVETCNCGRPDALEAVLLTLIRPVSHVYLFVCMYIYMYLYVC